ncbi:MAG: hypothetical protein ACM3WV_02060 [Bacillota bacterium]
MRKIVAAVFLAMAFAVSAVGSAGEDIYIDAGKLYLDKYNQAKSVSVKKEFLKNAETDFRHALKINPSRGAAYAGLARTYTRYSLFTPKPFFPFSMLPKFWMNNKEQKLLLMAMDFGADAVKYGSSEGESYLSLGEAELQSCSATESDKYLSEAFMNLQKAKELDKMNPEVYSLFSWAYLTRYYFDGNVADYNLALECLEKAYQLSPADSYRAKHLERLIIYLKTCHNLKMVKFLLELS